LPVRFSRLRIAGFKSFAEPAVVEIRPGLTGIVGPNGCGKSNVVEALRWAMGENSARSLRGGEMDDVIFAGTAARPSRNIGEVTLLLDGTQGTAPPPFHESAELEISRRIERGSGSTYRVNGRETRARDVQTLFADLATGAHSSGMVSQGRVASIVNARPDERRTLLEEAAGITGLHARRHEAELKLRAAEANLARAEDLRGQLEGQLEGLRRQARQANRYRNISGAIRTAEGEVLAIQRAIAAIMRDAAQAGLHSAGMAVAAATEAATAAGARAAEAAAILPELRGREAESRTALERHRLAGEALAGEEARAGAALRSAASRLAQIGADLAHAEQARTDAEAAVARLAAEADRIAAEDAVHPPRMAKAEAELRAAAEAVQAAEQAANRATEHAADLAARHAALTASLAQARQRAARLAGQIAALERDRAAAAAQRVDPARLAEAEAEVLAAEAALAAAREVLAAAETARAAARAEGQRRRAAAQESAQSLRAAAQAEGQRARAAVLGDGQARRAAAREAAQARRGAAQVQAAQTRGAAQAALAAAREHEAAAAGTQARLDAEVAALTEILAVRETELWPAMLDQLRVPEGLEAALGAALGEELDSAADTRAARHWRSLAPLDPPPALPDGAVALGTRVEAPAALARALSQIGLVDDAAMASGPALQAALRPGQMLVSLAGALWRWDGYTVLAGTQTASGVRLQQRNRLALLRGELDAARRAAAAASAGRAAAEAEERRVRADSAAVEAAERAAADAAEQEVQAATAEAERLVQAEAVAAEQAALALASAEEARAREAAEAAETREAAAEQQARAARDLAGRRLEEARATAARLAAGAAAALARMAGLDEQSTRLAAEREETGTALAATEQNLAALADPAAGRAAMEAARAALSGARLRETTARGDRDGLARAAAGRAHRARAIAAERADWQSRATDGAGRAQDLAARRDAARAEHAGLLAAPGEIAARRAAALDALEAAEAAHRAIADRLGAAETAAGAADRAARAAEATLAAARERVVRAEGEAAQAAQAWGVVAERIVERLGADPALPDPPAGIGPEAEEKSRRKLERLLRERDEMGPVNLRAELEADEIAAHVNTIVREREELTTAIAKLRGSIGSLNREGRERLGQVFAEVDKHFQTLFARMFGGGRAHLALVGSDDPLQAGLEIYAQPPGKKLATLSLLSGGEQALTALSLIFAVFRCNPAPICVLDEVDAPLDDANVERFCTLLQDMVRDTGTRFLVVTHHQMTMARMDRLYGVTMQERGVSRLLSVDLVRATELVDPTLMAAE
jgi:chromosome segregation protein